MNRVCLVGRITRDLELRESKTYEKFLFFTLAVTEYVSKEKSLAYFIPCFVKGKNAENMAKYLSKGSLISVDGKITTRSNKTPDERIETIVSVVVDKVKFLESKKIKNDNYQNYDFFDSIDNKTLENISSNPNENKDDDEFAIL
ncbi:single-stranded DNA-binding protein [Vibrio harveyi]|nr:single-stranded DNA-binding protein [Vibrio harveyi]